MVRLREEAGAAVEEKQLTLPRRWLAACHTKLHGVMCHVDGCAAKRCADTSNGEMLKRFTNAARHSGRFFGTWRKKRPRPSLVALEEQPFNFSFAKMTSIKSGSSLDTPAPALPQPPATGSESSAPQALLCVRVRLRGASSSDRIRVAAASSRCASQMEASLDAIVAAREEVSHCYSHVCVASQLLVTRHAFLDSPAHACLGTVDSVQAGVLLCAVT